MSYKPPRSIQEITSEYGQLLSRAGDLSYKIDALKRDLQMTHDQMRDLNFEFVAANEAEKKNSEAAKASTEAPKAVEAAPAENVVELKPEQSNG
jgi:uncharacterized coiled-coil DUF342 family protein